MSTEPIHDTQPAEEAWREIERLVGEIAELARSEASVRQFYQQLVDRTVLATAALGGAVWLCDTAGRFHLEYQIALQSTGLVASPAAQAKHGRLLDSIVRAGQPRAVPPHSGQNGHHEHENPAELFLLVCPLEMDQQPIGVLEIFQRATIHPAAQRGNLQLLKMVGELAVDFHRGRALRELRDREAASQQMDRFSQQVHGSLDLQSTAYAIANEGRQLLGCDRVSVARVQGSRCQLLAISGVDSFDRRASVVRRLEQLASRVAASGEPLWYTGDSSALAPQIEESLQAYVDANPVRTLIVIPLGDTDGEGGEAARPALATLIVERFDAIVDDLPARRLDDVARHAYLALNNATVYHSIPWLPALRLLGRAGGLFTARRLPKTAAALLVCTVLLALLTLVPTDFTVKVHGELQPLDRRDVFAPRDAVVSEIVVEHDMAVSAGTTLAALLSPELALDIQKVRGETDQTLQRLLSIAAEKRQASREDRDPNALSRLTSQEAELQQLLATQQQELAILQQQREALTVRSPIQGRVLTWRTEQLLTGRPVRKGQALMSVANVEGPWILELHVSDDQIGHVLAGTGPSGRQPVSFILATMPGVRYQGTIREIAGTATARPNEDPKVLVTVDIDRQEIPLLRPGATVVARIHCGRRSIAYVWLRGLLEAIQKRVLF